MPRRDSPTSSWASPALVAVALILTSATARAENLNQLIPGLFGGELATSVSPRDLADAQHPLVAERFRGLSAALAAARSQVPIPSAGGAFSFILEPEFDAYTRVAQSLGPTFAERAQTLGRRSLTLSTSYSHIEFNTLEGDSLHSLRSSQPALSDSFLAALPPGDQRRARDNTLDTLLDLRLRFDLFFLSAAYGVTDTIDVSAALSINYAQMSGQADAIIRDPHKNGGVYFSARQKGVVVGGTDPDCSQDFTCAHDSFSQSAFGTGDVFLRSKWRFHNSDWIDLAASGVLTIPTGNADDYLGFNSVTFTPWLIASKSFDRVSPHFNLGYAFRSAKDVSQAQWIAGADVRTTDWLTVAGDFLGYHDDHRDGVNDDILQSAVGAKINPFGQCVVGFTMQFPLNRDGVRADIIYSGQVEYTF